MAEFRWLKELHRRHVVRAAVIYAAAVWALAQGISQLSPVFGLSAGVTLWFVIVCAIGFPFWLVFAWYFKFTARGIEREGEAVKDEATVQRVGRKLNYWIIGILAVAVVLLLTNQLVLQRGQTMREFTAAPGAGTNFSPPVGSLLVLPFENLSGDPRQQYFSDGITEELTDALGQNPALRVIAWETAAKYRGSKQSATDIGKQLNVANVLLGSILHEGDEVRITAEMVNTVTGYQTWSAHYDQPFKNIFAVQDQVSAAVAQALKVKFAESDLVAGGTTNPQAHDLVLKGRALMDQYDAVSLEAARKDFERAITLDPNYADAHALLARALFDSTGFSDLSLASVQPKVRTEAKQALALDPRNADAWVALGNVDSGAKARAEYRKALALDPNNAAAHMDYGVTLPLKPGLAEFKEAAQLDPDSTIVQYNLASEYPDLGEWAQSVAATQALIRLDPKLVDGAFFLAYAYQQLHRYDKMVAAFDLVKPATPLDRQQVGTGRLVYRAVANPALRPQAFAALAELRQHQSNQDVAANLVTMYASLGEHAALLHLLQTFCPAEPVFCSDLAVNPLYAPLRADPAFRQLAEKYTTMTLHEAAAVSAPRPTLISDGGRGALRCWGMRWQARRGNGWPSFAG